MPAQQAYRYREVLSQVGRTQRWLSLRANAASGSPVTSERHEPGVGDSRPPVQCSTFMRTYWQTADPGLSCDVDGGCGHVEKVVGTYDAK